jgi:hypothetical protein
MPSLKNSNITIKLGFRMMSIPYYRSAKLFEGGVA